MKSRNKGSIMVWVLVVLFALSLLLVSYAKVVSNDYNISLSIFRQHVALHNSSSGISIARDYYKLSPNDLFTSFTNLNNNETEELYPIGILFSKTNLINEFNIERIYLLKDNEGSMYIYSEAKHSNAFVKTRIKVTDISNITFGEIEKIS